MSCLNSFLDLPLRPWLFGALFHDRKHGGPILSAMVDVVEGSFLTPAVPHTYSLQIILTFGYLSKCIRFMGEHAGCSCVDSICA